MERRSFDKALRKRLEAHGFTPEGHSYRASIKRNVVTQLGGSMVTANEHHTFSVCDVARTYLDDIADALKAWKQADSSVGEIELVDELTS